jgi:hypothetical protein
VITEHTGKFSIFINPRVVQYIPAVLLVLVFLLSFFPWVGIRPGGVWLDSQSGWQAAFASVSSPENTKKFSWFKVDEHKGAGLPHTLTGKAQVPGFGALAFFYLLLLLVNVAVAVAVAALPYFQAKVPQTVLQYLPWRWTAVAVVTLVTFALLLLQSAVGFRLERNANEAVSKVSQDLEKTWKEVRPASEAQDIEVEAAIFRGTHQQGIVRTFWYGCAFWFHFLALVFAFLVMLMEVRGQRPPPRVDVLW